jgi:hypothetical protein
METRLSDSLDWLIEAADCNDSTDGGKGTRKSDWLCRGLNIAKSLVFLDFASNGFGGRGFWVLKGDLKELGLG